MPVTADPPVLLATEIPGVGYLSWAPSFSHAPDGSGSLLQEGSATFDEFCDKWDKVNWVVVYALPRDGEYINRYNFVLDLFLFCELPKDCHECAEFWFDDLMETIEAHYSNEDGNIKPEDLRMGHKLVVALKQVLVLNPERHAYSVQIRWCTLEGESNGQFLTIDVDECRGARNPDIFLLALGQEIREAMTA